MLTFLHLIALGSFALAPQSNPERFSDVLYSATNAKYHLICEFHGGRVATPSGTADDRIFEVTVRNEQTGEVAAYRPQKREMPPNFGYRDVWSPDGEWLVLSLGSLDGFQLIKASDALAELKRSKPKEFLLLKSRTHKGRIYYLFLGWQSPAAFNFNLTDDTSNVTSTYHFNLGDFKLGPLFDGPGVADTYVTSEGERPIHGFPPPHRE